jgi:nucleoside-diphosphate-sugar epimerase
VTALRESDAYPAMAEDGHGWEKLFSERLCRHFQEDFGVPTRVARLHNVYGPHVTWEGGREEAAAALWYLQAHEPRSRRGIRSPARPWDELVRSADYMQALDRLP